MGSFYAVSSTVRIAFAVCALLSFLIQAVSFLLLLARSDGKQLLHNVFEALLVLHLAFSAFLLLSFQDQILQGNAALTAHMGIRWAALLPACAGFGLSFFAKGLRRTEAMFSVMFLILSLPCFDALPGRGFAWVFLAGVSFFLLRGTGYLFLNVRHLRTNLSRLSIKEAMDALHGGILFATARGRIVLQNRSMLVLTHRILGKAVSNANELWARLPCPALNGESSVTELDGKLLIRMPGAAWEFSRQTVSIASRAYTLICAADVTEADRITHELAEMTGELEKTADRLQFVLDHYEEIKSAREAVELKRRIHDIMGQRVSILNRALLREPDNMHVLTEIAPLLSDLMQDIREAKPDCPDMVLANMKRSFALAGAVLRVDGGLPVDEAQALLLLKILREAATNAVRHAGAAKIHAVLTQAEAGCSMTVTNDGKPPACPIAEGGGLTGMRDRLSWAGGTLTLDIAPVFRLTATLPK